MTLLEHIKQQIEKHDKRDTILHIEVDTFNFNLLKQQNNLNVEGYEVIEGKNWVKQTVVIIGKTIKAKSSSTDCKK